MSKQYSAAEKAAWGRQQDEIRAAGGIAKWRAQQGIAAPTPAKRQSRAKPLIADVSGSDCFNSLVFTGGEVIAQFAKDGSVYAYPMSRADAKEWFSDDSLGEFFNSEIR